MQQQQIINVMASHIGLDELVSFWNDIIMHENVLEPDFTVYVDFWKRVLFANQRKTTLSANFIWT